MMKNKSFKKWGMLVSAAAIVICALFATRIHADTVDPVDDGRNTITGTVGIKYSAEDRAKAKAFYAALAHCYTVTDDVDNLAIYWALQGKYGADTDDGEANIGDNLDDDFLNDIRGWAVDDRSVDCTEGNLIQEAFDFFGRVAKNGKQWSEYTLSDKQDLFCGWFRIGYDHTGSDDSYAGSDDAVGQECRDAIAQHGGVEDLKDYAFMKRKDGGRPHLANYINNVIFGGEFEVNHPYTDDEKYYVYASLLRHYCAEERTGDPNIEHFNTSAFDVNNSSLSIDQTTKYFKVEHDVKNANWNRIESNGWSIDQDDDDCDDDIEPLVDDETDTLVVAARDNLLEGYKLHCLKSYTDFYNAQTEYFNSLTNAQKNGDKAAYVTWYQALPATPDESACYTISSPNPIFKCSVDDYVNTFQSTNPDPDSPGYSGYVMPSPDTPTPGEENESKPDCYSKAGSLGWIICPLITTGAQMVQETYEGMIVPFLRMDPELFKQDSGTYQAWNIFRNIANVAFVLAFLVVIFSQITGMGIDNYGIKKILPKLIVAAILINLSYIVCQLAVDICNILGAGIGNIFQTIGDTVMESTPAYCLEGGQNICTASAGGGAGAGAIVAIVAVVIGITAIAVLAIGPQILIPVLLAILSFVIAVFFLFVILGIRQALAVLLVVASPLAFLCYMLPNTKKIYDKWFNGFKTLLVAYPICSALVYGGDMVAKIILNSYGRQTPSNLATMTPVLSAGIIAVAPIFLIPKVIKSSLGAIGNVATRLQGGARVKTRNAANRGLRSLPFNNPDNNRFLGFGTRAMNQRARYKRQQRDDIISARQSEYNAKKGERALYGRKDLAAKAAAGTLTATERRQRDRALSAINAESASSISTYASSFKSMGGDDEIIKSVQQSLDNGTLTADQYAAAIQAVHDEDKAAALTNMRVGGTGENAGKNVLSTFKGGGIRGTNERQKIQDALTARSNNVYAQSVGKLMSGGENGEGLDMDEMMTSGKLREKIQGAGDGVMQNQDKDVFKIEGMGDLFSASQLAAGVGAGYSGTQAGNFNAMLQESGRGSEVLDSMSMDQFAGLSSQAYAGKNHSGETTNMSVMDAFGGANAIMSNANAKANIMALSSSAGDTARGGMDTSAMTALDINTGPGIVSTGQYVNANAGKNASEVTIIQRNNGKFYRVDRSGGTVTETEVNDIRNYKKKS